MEYFLNFFGDVTIGSVVILICALSFLYGCYKKIGKFFSDKAIAERENEEQLKKVFRQVQQYPEWHKQSIDMREKIDKSIDKVDKKLDRLQQSNDEGMALTWRYRILRFNDEVKQEVNHTEEHFNQILEDITKYEKYCKDNPDFENNKAVLAIENIKKVYQKCTEEGSFL